MNVRLKNAIESFDISSLMNRLEYPKRIREWVYRNAKNPEEMYYLSVYICHDAGYRYVENAHGFEVEKISCICAGCKCQTSQYVCSKRFRQPFGFECWFDCDKKFI